MSFEAMTWAVKQKLPVKQKIVLLMLADRVNKDTGRCFPSIAGLAEDCGMSDTSVREALRSLREAGLVVAHERKVGPVNLTNEYEVVMGEIPPPLRNTHHPPTQYAVPPLRNTHPNLSLEPVSEPGSTVSGGFDLLSEDTTTAKKPNVSEHFDRFWKVYPKKVGKPAAEKNFARAVKAGADPEDIIAGARRYAASDQVARGYVKHPQGWLTDQRWLDDTPSPAAVSVRDYRHGEIVR